MLTTKPIIVVTQSRSGSNLLQGYLGEIPGVVAFNEIFRKKNPTDINRIAKFIDLTSEKLDQLHKLQTRSLVAFWALFSQTLLAEEIRPAAKIFYPHATRNDPIWTEFRNCKVLQLVRENVLASVVSRQLAQKSGQWKAKGGKAAYGHESIEIRTRDCEYHLADLKDNVNWTRRKFSGMDYSEISYDDLPDINVAGAVLSKVFSQPITLKKQSVSRQRERALQEVVANYEDVKRFDRNFSLVMRA